MSLLSASLHLPALPASVSVARRTARPVLAAWALDAGATEDVLLVLSELLGLAVRRLAGTYHAVEVRLDREREALQVCVHVHGRVAAHSVGVHPADSLAQAVVGALSSSWTCQERDGRLQLCALVAVRERAPLAVGA